MQQKVSLSLEGLSKRDRLYLKALLQFRISRRKNQALHLSLLTVIITGILYLAFECTHPLVAFGSSCAVVFDAYTLVCAFKVNGAGKFRRE